MKRNPSIQYESIETIKAFQEERLRDAIAYLASNSPFYKRMFANNNIDPTSIRTIADLQRLPVTTKTDLQEYNDDFLCVDKVKVIDYVTTSGTLGNPVTFALTENDLDRLSYNEFL